MADIDERKGRHSLASLNFVSTSQRGFLESWMIIEIPGIYRLYQHSENNIIPSLFENVLSSYGMTSGK
jgi:hypothetical protein